MPSERDRFPVIERCTQSHLSESRHDTYKCACLVVNSGFNHLGGEIGAGRRLAFLFLLLLFLLFFDGEHVHIISHCLPSVGPSTGKKSSVGQAEAVSVGQAEAALSLIHQIKQKRRRWLRTSSNLVHSLIWFVVELRRLQSGSKLHIASQGNSRENDHFSIEDGRTRALARAHGSGVICTKSL